jgi:prepilin-type N-terminal cleavage/methylation domain-containing protein
MIVKAGFTLMEVSVAIAVLAAGVVVFGRFLDGFNRIRALEREQARVVLETAHAVEYFIQNPPTCRDTTFAFGALAASNQTSAARNQTPAAAVQVTLKTISGPKPIAWLSACVVTPCPRTISKAPVFRRLVRCVKD